jgi:hypothetical protein
MAVTLPGLKVWENTTPAVVSNTVTGWYETTGYTNLVLAYVLTNSTGSTVLTIEGSFDGATLDSTMTYAAVGASPQTALVIPVMHTFVRFRVVQTTATATVTTIYVQARA